MPTTSAETASTMRSKPTARTRALLLLACVALGTAAGLAGRWLMDSDAWFLAVPALMALVWLLVADPNDCHRCHDR
ncbi:MAG: hypothetical protein AB1430_14835 [Pseudomonadota bacterium]